MNEVVEQKTKTLKEICDYLLNTDHERYRKEHLGEMLVLTSESGNIMERFMEDENKAKAYLIQMQQKGIYGAYCKIRGSEPPPIENLGLNSGYQRDTCSW